MFCKDTCTIHALKNVIVKGDVTYQRTSPTQTIKGDDRDCTMSNSNKCTTVEYTVNTTNWTATVGGAATMTTDTYDLTASTATYVANHNFSGDGFMVGTGSGFVPVTILLGSNSW